LASAHTDCLIQLLKSVATDDSFPGCEAAYLTLFASEVKRLFSLFFAARRGVSQLSVGQWWRIIGSFTAGAIVFLNFIFNCTYFIPINIKNTQIG
ncbi:hypothetical protein, partial [Xenorhabdus vietnamensis]|uniref:hypothetical protein n=1 Tax=Xenorhabdus vietnamensis TaxID=351656 RepID=UPI001ABF3169